jgi:cytochrome c
MIDPRASNRMRGKRFRHSRSALLRTFALAAALVVAAGCRDEPAPRFVPGGDPAAGRAALRDYGCGACHMIPGVREANGRIAPPLIAYADRAYVGGVVSNSPANLIAWIMDPQQINPRSAMPNLGVPEAQARHMAAYLMTLR